MFVFFPDDLKVGVKTIKTYAERMRSEGVGRAMMVTVANITPFARQCLQEMNQKYYIETVRHCHFHELWIKEEAAALMLTKLQWRHHLRKH